MDYAKTAAKVQRMLKKAGQTVTLTRMEPGAYNPETGTVVSAGTTYAGPGVLLDYSQREKDGTVILQTDQRVYLAPLIGAAPKPGDTLTIGTEIFNVVNSRPLAPGGICVLHDVQVRVS